MIVYLAGPFSAETQWERDENTRLVEAAALRVWELGHTPLYTHRMWGRFWGLVHEHDVMERCQELILVSDVVILIGKWEESHGTIEEVRYANLVGTPVLEGVEHLALSYSDRDGATA